jgi:hypothetical protein
MKRSLLALLCCVLAPTTFGWANHTRTDILMAGDYLDDIVYIDRYPHMLRGYANVLYGDIKQELSGYGFVLSPERKYGAIGCWQAIGADSRFNIGYAVQLMNFDIGISGSPVTDHYRIGFGIGRSFFSRRIDLSVLATDGIDEQSVDFNVRIAGRRGDFIIMPKYALTAMQEPFEYDQHKLGLMIQRLILNDGFVYFIAEYDFARGDLAHDLTHVYVGLDLPLNRTFGLLVGVKETFTDGFDAPEWRIATGFSVFIREFAFAFHINHDRFFDKDEPILNSFGLNLDFGRF